MARSIDISYLGDDLELRFDDRAIVACTYAETCFSIKYDQNSGRVLAICPDDERTDDEFRFVYKKSGCYCEYGMQTTIELAIFPQIYDVLCDLDLNGNLDIGEEVESFYTPKQGGKDAKCVKVIVTQKE